jgi:hypothetical protein
MGCGSSSQAADVSSPLPTLLMAGKAESDLASYKNAKLVQGQSAIIRNSRNARLNGQKVICESYNADLDEWLVKGNRFPLTVGMSLGEQYLEPIVASAPVQASDNPQQASTFRTLLENCNETLVTERVLDGSHGHVGEFVDNVCAYAHSIIKEGSCPFATAYEVRVFNEFCLNVCIAWSEHMLEKDELTDKEFYSQMSGLCEILCFLDTTAVPLPEGVQQNIQLMQGGLFPHWVEAQIANGNAALECCIAVGEEWGLEETPAFQKALTALER